MKTNTHTILIFTSLLILACKKDKEVTKPVEFKETTYQTLGLWDSTGKPNYLQPRENISSDLIAFAKENLPEKDLRQTNPELLKQTAIADIHITQPSDVFITFISQGSLTFKNTVGFYTYPTNMPPTKPEDIKNITYIFPQSGAATPLRPGDNVKLGRFEPGISIGFVLMQKAWDATTKNINNKSVHFLSDDLLNPEIDPNLKKHVVLINYAPENKVLLGFEDLDRTTRECDHDFNDLVIYATITP